MKTIINPFANGNKLQKISDNTDFIPYTGATTNVDLGTYNLTTPKLIGGTATTADLSLQTTSGVGTTGADMHFLVGNNGATEAMTILNSGNVGIGTTSPSGKLHVLDTTNHVAMYLETQGTNKDVALHLTSTGSGTSYIDYGRTTGGNSLQFYSSKTGVGNTVTFKDSGNVGIGEVAPAYSLEITNNTLTPTFGMSDDDVAHGVTTIASTDTFFHMTSASTTVGGVLMTGLVDTTGVSAFIIRGVMNSNPTDTTPAVLITGHIASGTGVEDMGALETVFQVKNNDNTTAGITILGSDFVGINNVSPLVNLDVKGSARFGDSTTNYVELSATGITYEGTAKPMIDMVWYMGTETGQVRTPATNGATMGTYGDANGEEGTADFDKDTDEYVDINFKVPRNYFSGGDGVITIEWFGALTTGNCIWGALISTCGEGVAINPAFGTASTTTTTIAGTTLLSNLTTITLDVSVMATTMAAGDKAVLRIYRDANAGGDTLNEDARIRTISLLLPVE